MKVDGVVQEAILGKSNHRRTGEEPVRSRRRDPCRGLRERGSLCVSEAQRRWGVGDMREEVAMGSGAVSGPGKWGLRGLRQPHNEELLVTPVWVGVGGCLE